ncbi:hypothetical protein ACPPVW_11770 [Leifsonia sp. McL0607]|uniref:hypothetical protein n=1 Tax=Leifsonia sp. McL0607 TaxID=3415672 RepID=UPI003CE878CC
MSMPKPYRMLGPAAETQLQTGTRYVASIRAKNAESITHAFCARTLEEIACLGDGWDGYKGIAPAKTTRLNAWQALREFEAEGLTPNDITPNSNGTISLEWETDSAEAYLEVGKTRFSMYIKERGKTSYFDGLATDIPRSIPQLLRRAVDEAEATKRDFKTRSAFTH